MVQTVPGFFAGGATRRGFLDEPADFAIAAMADPWRCLNCLPAAKPAGGLAPSSGAGSSASAEPDALSFVASFEANVQRQPSKRLYTWLDVSCREEGHITFLEAREHARAVCIALRCRWDMKTGDRVLMVYPPGLEFAVAFLGCLYAGVTAVPYYPPALPMSVVPSDGAWALLADGLAKLAHVAETCQPTLLLSSSMYLRAKSAALLLRRISGKERPDGTGWPALPSHATDDLRPPAQCSACTNCSLTASNKTGWVGPQIMNVSFDLPIKDLTIAPGIATQTCCSMAASSAAHRSKNSTDALGWSIADLGPSIEPEHEDQETFMCTIYDYGAKAVPAANSVAAMTARLPYFPPPPPVCGGTLGLRAK